MQSKSTKKIPPLQARNVIPGILPADFNTEFIGVRETKSVFILSNGRTMPFSSINPVLKARLFQMMLADEAAMEVLQHLGDSDAALERFVFCLFGDADFTPDVSAEGRISGSENFQCGANCTCLKWNSKKIMLNGNALTPREVEIVPLLASDMADKQIADVLGISPNTLVTHKQNIYGKAGVMSRPGLVERAFSERVIQ